MKSTMILLLFILSGATSYSQQKSVTLFVATNGKTSNLGTLASPFLSPQDAIAAIGKIPGPVDATVYIEEGHYNFNKSFIIAQPGADSTRHITFANYQNGKVVFTGSSRLDNKTFRVTSDPAILNRLPAVARGKVYETDLHANGVTDYGKGNRHGYKTILPATLEFFYNGIPLTVARYPNVGLLPVGTVLDPGTNLRLGGKEYKGGKFVFSDARMNNWKEADNAWVGGFFSYGYADDYLKVDTFDFINKAIRLKQPATYSMFSSDNTSTAELKNGQKIRGFYVYNLLEEIDIPGEWFLDEKTNKLYLWPPDNSINTADLEVSLLEDPIVVLSHTINITFKGIEFAYSRGMGFYIENTRNTKIDHCIFDGLGTVAISTGDQFNYKRTQYQQLQLSDMEAALKNTNLQILSCSISNIGSGGVILDGGDRKNLIPANNIIDNCEFFNFSRINKTFSPAISLNGVGNQITHCYIHDALDQAIIFYGNNHRISYNHIQNVASYGTDATAVGTGGDITSTGTTISYNYFENIVSSLNTSICAIYLDDGSSGMEIDGNVFYKSGTSGSYRFGAIHINGGSNNYFRNNYFIDCNQAFSNNQYPDAQWRIYLTNPVKAKIFSTALYLHSDAFIKAYPWLIPLTDSNTIATRVNYIFNSLAYNVNVFAVGSSLVNKNVFSTNQDPGFADLAKGNFTLVKYPAALSQSNDWKPIPFSEIGLKK